MRDVYIYRSYIVQKNYKFVLAEIKDNAPTPLQAVKLLATYLSSPDNKEISLVTLKEWMSDGAVASNPVLQVVAATIYYDQENYEEAMRCVYQSNSLEGLSMLVQIYLKINRVDQAEKELRGMQKVDEDATITQLTAAWVYLAQGGEKISEAQAIFQELMEKYGPTVALLNGLALGLMQQKRYTEAEKYLLQALEKNSNDADTLVNLVACSQQNGKAPEVISRQLNQLKLNAPEHWWVAHLKTLEDGFDLHAGQFAL